MLYSNVLRIMEKQIILFFCLLALAVTTVSGQSTVPPGTTDSGITSSGNNTSNATAAAPTNASVTASANETTVTMTTTLPPTTTTTPAAADLPHLDTATFTWSLTLGTDNTSDLVIVDANASVADLSSTLWTAFSEFSSGYELLQSNTDDKNFTFRLYFLSSKLTNSTTDQLNNTLTQLSTDVTVNHQAFTSLEQFSSQTADICTAEHACSEGFFCVPSGCRHLCHTADQYCGQHGQCHAQVTQEGKAALFCTCESSYSTEYFGDRCQDSHMGKDKVIAIVAALLGVIVFLLLVALLITCIKRRVYKTPQEYVFSREAYVNSTYENTPTK
ncbi:uncharacterized protein LOC101851183 [Aplysia californica]|uniref:Uncharacterized protein LOC101851183 n=1 Tax=Aplysia californica TaxID=6500 RepID=A0ABM0JK74_APLCA|nr:uncharacterized protein LOC101851183 [Aplysia californica]